jgi:CRISPR-associated endonuclease/helicase Cas3
MTLRLWQHQGGYDPDVGWTEDPADVPTVDQPATASTPDKLSADESSESRAWLSLADHTADAVAETRELARAFELSDKPEGIALAEAACWHDVGKACIRWKHAIDQFLASLQPKVEECRREENDPQVQRLLDQFAAMLAVPGDDHWAKFPDIKWMLNHPDLPAARKAGLRRSLYTPFQPRYRHEAASALVAWQAWRDGKARSLSDLAVYLIASHHGKVRTVLRSIRETDAVFGICDGDELLPVEGTLPTKTTIPTEARWFGASGRWDDEGGRFLLASTSWVSLVADLLGGLPKDYETANRDRSASLGPFRLGFLEMLFRVADARASAHPGKGRHR